MCVFVCEIILSLIVPGLHFGACPGREERRKRSRGDKVIRQEESALEAESSLAVE